ncbi:hypothetical protein GTX14_11785 [Streptomyces sp. SID4944]|nr:hypothetical protein [Streptomyces sp. SID4944]
MTAPEQRDGTDAARPAPTDPPSPSPSPYEPRRADRPHDRRQAGVSRGGSADPGTGLPADLPADLKTGIPGDVRPGMPDALPGDLGSAVAEAAAEGCSGGPTGR